MVNSVWERIMKYEGETFTQIKGKEFTYTIKNKILMLSTTNRTVSKGTFEKALHYVPFENTSVIQHLQAPSYLYAILMDKRIREKDW